MADDVVLNKVASLERCIQRIRQVYGMSNQNHMMVKLEG
jgi:hypothetical protein